MNKVVIFGNRSTAAVLLDYLHRDSEYKVKTFTVDSAYIQESTFLGLPLVPFDLVKSLYPPGEYQMMIGIGYTHMNKLKAERFNQAKEMGYQLINYISPRSSIWSGFVVNENVRIHDATIRNKVTIARSSLIGAGAVILEDTVENGVYKTHPAELLPILSNQIHLE